MLDLAERLRPDLVVGTELELCRRLREGEPGRFWDRNVPVILLGRHDSDVVDRVRALERGADDYLGRPFSYEELLARIRAVLRRTSPRNGEVVRAGELEIDRDHAAWRACSASACSSPRASTSCSCGWRSTRRASSRKTSCCARSGDSGRWGGRRTLDSHASRVRRKIAAFTETPYVINEWGVGYRLMLP